jgi:hypothetical protein
MTLTSVIPTQTAAGRFAETTVRRHLGVPTIFVEGQPIQGLTATSVSFGDPQVIEDFVNSGTEIMMIWIEAGLYCWKGPGLYDWSYAEKKLSLFEAHGGNTRWIIRVRLGLLDSWLKHRYPDEFHNPTSNKFDRTHSVSNIVSPIWLEHVQTLLRDFVSWLRGTRWASRIIGFMLNAGSTEEWLLFDVDQTSRGVYHGVYTREFRQWLRSRYKEDAQALRAAWNQQGSLSFETAECPRGHMRKGSHIWGPFSLRDPRREQAAIDYYQFLNERLADHFIAVCKTVKEAAETPIICGGFHSYLWWETGVYSYIQEYGHGLIQRLKQSPWVDFVSDITSYDGRYPGGPSGYLGLPQSLQLDNKLHYTEVDLSTVSVMPEESRQEWARSDTSAMTLASAEPILPDRLWKWDWGYCGRDAQEQIALLQREHMHNLITGSPFWWFDIRNYNYHEPWIVQSLKTLADVGSRAIDWNRSSVAEVAFVCSEDTPMYQAAMNGELLRFELESAHSLLLDLCARKWGLAGVPFDTYELHDLAHKDFPGFQYKLLIFVNCAVVTPQAAEGIRRWQGGERTLCWTYAPAVYHDRQINPAAGEEIVGTRIAWRNRRENVWVTFNDAHHPLTAGGPTLSFGTEGSVGPVFFADDPQATVLGRLRGGNEPAFTVRDHGDWRSVYLAMLNFNADLLRNLARFAGAHAWIDSDDVIYANRSMLCLHTSSAGSKVIKLNRPSMVTDLWSGERSSTPLQHIQLKSPAYRTYAWHLDQAEA